MAINPAVSNYLQDVIKYYQINQPAQAAQPQQGLGAIAAPAINLVPAFGLGGMGAGGGGGVGINIIGDLNQAREYQREQRDENRATSAAWIGAILTIIGSAGLACIMSKWNEASERLQEARDFKENQIPLINPQAQRQQLEIIVNKDIRILEKKVSQARNIVILTGLALAAAVTGFVAGMLSMQWLITTAIIVGVAVLAIGAFAAVYYCMQKAEKPEGVVEYMQANLPPAYAPAGV